MKLLKNNFEQDREQNYKNSIEKQIVEQIILLCKHDSNFNINNKINKTEEYIESIKEKINKKNILLDKSDKIENDMMEEINKLENYNYDVKCDLLNKLGTTL